MDAANSLPKAAAAVKRWSIAMRILALLSIAWTLLSIAALAFGFGFRIVLDTETGIGVFGPEDFSRSQRLILISIVSLINLCWFWMLLQVVFLSREFSKGSLISGAVAHHLRHFAFGLFALAISETSVPLLLNFYLQYLDKCTPLKSASLFFLGEGTLESLMAGTLVIIVAMIIDHSREMREDLELTV